MSLLLELESENGNLNLTKYLRVQKGEGLDPVDPVFSERVFSHSLLKAGGTLALENLKIRELIFPLRLSAASKPALNALVREINIILNTAGAQVEWRDEGSTESTFLYLASGQFDAEFDYREGEKFMLKGKLRLFTQPLGVATTAMRALPLAAGATSVASAPVMVLYAASPVLGDAPAAARAIIKNATGVPAQSFAAFSALPNASYSPWLPAASYGIIGIGNYTRSATAGWTYMTGGTPQEVFQIPREGGVYAGDHRILAIARRANNATPALLAVEGTPRTASGLVGASGLNAVAVPGASAGQPWNLLDLGVISKASLAAQTQWNLTVSSTATIALYGLIMLPDNSTTWLTGAPQQITFDGLTGHVGLEATDYTGRARGAIPTVAPGTRAPTFALLAFPYLEGPSYFNAEVLVQDRFRYAV